LPPWLRDALLQRVAAELRGREIGSGAVHRAVRVAQRKFYDAPLER